MIQKEEVLKNIDCYLFDLDGTIYLGRKLIDGAYETIEFLRKIGKRVIFLTNNSSVSKNYYVKKINDMGIPCEDNDVYTSGNAAQDLLNSDYVGKSVYLVGTEELKKEFIEKGIKLVDDNPDIVLLSYDKELTYNKLVLATRFLANGATYIATHPDVNCPATPVYEPDIGSMIELIYASVKRRPDVICGKPYQAIAIGVSRLAKAPFSKMAMVGDRLYTDVLFGLNNKMYGILVLSGETTEKDLEKSNICPSAVLPSVFDIKKYLEKIR